MLLDGREVSGPDGYEPPERRGVGLMFQDYALFPHLTNLQNVMFGLKDLPAREADGGGPAGARPGGAGEPGGRLSRTRSPAASSSGWRSPAPSRRAPACC